MIHSLEIKNIQSHKDSKLEFVDGVNVIIGSSNQGKSAILRALYWVRNNRPLGIDNLASHWAVSDKGYLMKDMSVKLTNDNGVVERRRTRDDNQYIVNGEVLNVVKTDVPSQVESVLRLSETNVQKQLDSPFLLSKTNGEIAKYFNQMVNLDIIDKVLSNAESTRRKLNSTIDSASNDIETFNKKLNEFDWIDDVEALIDKAEAYEKEFNDICNKIDSLDSSILAYEDRKEWIDYIESIISKTKKKVKEIDSIVDEIDRIEEETNKLSYSIDEVENFKPYDFSMQNRFIRKIEVILEEDSSNEISKLKDSLEDYSYHVNMLEMNEEKISTYRKMLPKVCPLCGKPLEEDDHAVRA